MFPQSSNEDLLMNSNCTKGHYIQNALMFFNTVWIS